MRLLRYGGIFIFGYILILALTTPGAFNAAYLAVAAVLVWLAAKYVIARPNLSAKNIRRLILAIVLLGGLVRFLWAVSVPTRPVSDFRAYHETAVKLSQGQVKDRLSKNPGYSLLLSLGYRIEPAPVSGKIINAALSTLTIYLIFLLGSALSAPAAGLLAAFLFAVLPAETNMVSVLGTEVAATTLITAATLALVIGCRRGSRFAWFFLSGLLLGTGVLVRSSLVFLAPILLGFILLTPDSTGPVKLARLASLSVGAAVSLALLVGWYSASTGSISLKPLQTQDAYAFLSGTNIQAGGEWNEADAARYFSWPAESRDRLAVQEAFRRVGENIGGFLQFIPHKYAILMGDQTYGNTWSVYPINWRDLKPLRGHRENIMDANLYLNQAFYILLLGLAVYHFIDYRFPAPAISAMALAAVLLTLLPHAILEVQSRYHHIILPFIVLLAAQGLFEAVSRSHGLPGRQESELSSPLETS